MFAIGDKKWPGLSKLVEECGEVVQVIGKLMGSRGNDLHWNVPSLKAALEDEVADLLAACDYVMEKCWLNIEHITTRRQRKLETYRTWHKEDPEDVSRTR